MQLSAPEFSALILTGPESDAVTMSTPTWRDRCRISRATANACSGCWCKLSKNRSGKSALSDNADGSVIASTRYPAFIKSSASAQHCTGSSLTTITLMGCPPVGLLRLRIKVGKWVRNKKPHLLVKGGVERFHLKHLPEGGCLSPGKIKPK